MDTDPDYFPSASSSIILLDEPDLSNSIYRDKIDAIMGNDPDREHPAPPTSEASIVASPGSKAPPKRSHTRASDMSPPDLTEPYSPAAGNESAWGLCGVGAWADMASPVILAKKPGTSSRRQ
ncbi:hypothetical protein ACJZ2D_003149 [Fusarium nematophilum]